MKVNKKYTILWLITAIIIVISLINIKNIYLEQKLEVELNKRIEKFIENKDYIYTITYSKVTCKGISSINCIVNDLNFDFNTIDGIKSIKIEKVEFKDIKNFYKEVKDIKISFSKLIIDKTIIDIFLSNNTLKKFLKQDLETIKIKINLNSNQNYMEIKDFAVISKNIKINIKAKIKTGNEYIVKQVSIKINAEKLLIKAYKEYYLENYKNLNQLMGKEINKKLSLENFLKEISKILKKETEIIILNKNNLTNKEIITKIKSIIAEGNEYRKINIFINNNFIVENK